MKLKKSDSALLRWQSALAQTKGKEEGKMGTAQGGNKDRPLHILSGYELSSICAITSECKTNQTSLQCFHHLCPSLSQKPEKNEREKKKKMPEDKRTKHHVIKGNDS